MRAAGEHVWAVTVAGRRIFYLLFAAVVISFLFVAPARTAAAVVKRAFALRAVPDALVATRR